MILKQLHLTTLLLQVLLAFGQSEKGYPDVQEYNAKIILDLVNRSIEGNVTIDFRISSEETQVYFDCGNLEVSSVRGDHVKSFRQENSQLIIEFSNQSSGRLQVSIEYSGSPKRGLIFKEDLAYTVFSTDQWMVCNMDPSDRAQLTLEIAAADTLNLITSNSYEAPAYTYGFAVGSFDKFSEVSDGTTLTYYSNQYSEKQLAKIFRETPRILAFLEEKSGVPYYQDSYSQILAGDHYQEMAGFAMIKSSYGDHVLSDSTETNLITHELAHQWWGNQITCQNWNHFWLNEAFATYLSAAYNEERFGKEKYKSDIDSYFQVYKKVKDRGVDKPLVFDDWSNPSRDDRNIVYFKGAFVLHLLREEIGDEAFWKGLKHYSQENFGKSVTTSVFQKAMEKASSKSLDSFFIKWVYGSTDPDK
ncbi:M1 family aminopeptidase [Ekhidna sp.]|uniref:M1 family aminopeptidase n=1 Tax=Ekhidna sp. TaxID=2608089 RepID=UPI0032ED3CAE